MRLQGWRGENIIFPISERVTGRLVRGAAWTTAGRVFTNLVGLASTIILARLLLPSDFGIVAIATTILAIAQSVTDLSLSSALIQRKDVQDEHFHSVWTISILRSAVIAIVIGLAAYPLARFYGDPDLFAVLIAAGVIAAIPGLGSPRLAMMTKALIFWQDFAVQVTQRIVIVIASVAVAVVTQSYWALLIGNLVGAVSSVALSYALAPYLPRLSLSKFRELFAYSFWLSMGATVNTLNWKFDQLVLGYLVGNTSLGIYTIADNLSGLPVRETTAPLNNTLFPAFSRIAHDPERLRQGYLRAQSMVCAIALPVGFGFATVADPIVRLLLGEKWLPAIPIIQILSWTFALQSLSNGLQPLGMATGATKLLFGRDVRTFLIRIPFIFAGYLLGGLLGVVVGRSISSAIGTIWNIALVTKLIGLPLFAQFCNCWRSLVATGIMVAVTFALQSELALHSGVPHLVTILLLVLIGGLVYSGSSIGLWLMTGRLAGPETELGDMAASLLAKVRRAIIHGRPPRAAMSHAAFVSADPHAWYETFPAETRTRTPPRRFGMIDVDFGEMVEPIPALGVYALPAGRAMGQSSWCFSAGGAIVRETTWYGSTLDGAALPGSFEAAKRLPGTCLSLISEFAIGNYGHYLLDCLSRLGIARKAGWMLDRIDHFYLYDPPSKSARQMLDVLGVPADKCVWANHVPSIIADILLVTSFPGTRRNYAAVVPATLGGPFQEVPCTGRRIFLPRRGTRAIENGAEIERISQEMGLKLYNFAEVVDEFAYFREAELIVGAHGAGLTNIAVCLPGTKVLELIPTDHVYPYYYSLAEAAGLDYACLAGRSAGMRETGAWGPSPFDFTINPDEYRSTLGTLLAELDTR